jgi:hypothetical protein
VLVLVLAGLALAASSAARRTFVGPQAHGGWSDEQPFGPMLAGALLTTAVLVELVR